MANDEGGGGGGAGNRYKCTDKLNFISADNVVVSAPVQCFYLVPSMYSINIGCNPSSKASSLALNKMKNKW